MHLLSLAIGLPLALATFEIPQGYSHQLSARNGKRSQSEGGLTKDLCGNGVNYTFPYCKKDTDCQKSNGLSNLPPSSIPYVQAILENGQGTCDHDDGQPAGEKSCNSVLETQAQIDAACAAIVDVYSRYLGGLKLKSACFPPDGGFLCDMLCDPKVNPDCGGETKIYDVPCGSLASGNGTNGPCNWGCPKSQLEPGETWPGQPDASDKRPISEICAEKRKEADDPKGGSGSPAPSGSGGNKHEGGKKHKHPKKHHGKHHKPHKHN